MSDSSKTQSRADTGTDFNFKYALDPFRIIAALFRYLLLVLLLGCAGLAVGYVTYTKFFHREETFAAKIKLLKTDTESGAGAYSPSQLDDEVIYDLHYDPVVQAETAEALDITITPQRFREFFTTEGNRRVGSFTMRPHSQPTEEKAVVAANSWAAALVSYSRKLQIDEATNRKVALQAEFDSNQLQLEEVKKKVKAYSEQHGLFDADLQVKNAVNDLVQINNRLTKVRMELREREGEFRDFVRGLQTNRLALDQIGAKQKELESLLEIYTAENIIVQSKQQEIADLRNQRPNHRYTESELIRDGQIVVTERDLGALNFTALLRLNDQMNLLTGDIKDLETRQAAKSSEVNQYPALQVGMAEIRQQRTEREAHTASLTSQINSINLFVRTAPGYLRIFQPPGLSDVESSWDYKDIIKMVGLLGGGLLAGLGLGVLFALSGEYSDRRVRTPLQAAIATRTHPTLLHNKQDQDSVREIWMTAVANAPPGERHCLFAVLDQSHREELFWQDLFKVIQDDDAPALFIDASTRPIPDARPDGPSEASSSLQRIKTGDSSIEEVIKVITSASPETYVLCRWGREPNANLIALQQHIHRYALLVSPSRAEETKVASQARIYRDLFGSPKNLILVDQKPGGVGMRLVQNLERSWFKWRARK